MWEVDEEEVAKGRIKIDDITQLKIEPIISQPA